MNSFLNINWTPPLEDLIDNPFISEDRLEKESVMHKIMTGNFIDPFKNIEDDYKEIKIDFIEGIDTISSEVNQQDKNENVETIENQKEVQIKAKKINKHYIPGIIKPLFKFPKISKLNKEEQAMCLRVLLRFSESEKPKITQIEREELKKYMDLQKVIFEEQDEFLEFAKSKWHERSLSLKCEDYINFCWKLKMQYIHKLPRYYAEVKNVPFLADKNVEIKFVSVCLQMGQLPEVILPTFIRPYFLKIKSYELKRRFPHTNYVCNESSVSHKLPVSEDENCQKLAENNDVDIVISSSGLNCLVNNIGPSYSNSWVLPLVIKKHNDKNVIYIDKPGPPLANTTVAKNNWVYKYILKYHLTQAEQFTLDRCDNVFDNVTSEELLKLEEEHDDSLAYIGDDSHLNVIEKNKHTEKSLQEEDLKIDPNISKDTNLSSELSSYKIKNSSISSSTLSTKSERSNIAMTVKDNVSYKLFSIGPQSSEQNELMKNAIKEYKMLVRTKTDGFEILPNNMQRLLLLAPKLEYQADLGAEAVTLEESLKQWISLIFRPNTFLARVRISAKTSEVFQIEQRTVMSINNEIKRLYNVKVEDSLTLLHNVIQSLSNLSPGRYIMRHTIRHGAFAIIYKEVETPGKNVFDLHTMYTEQYHTLPNSSWIPLDKIVPTPMLKYFERMPAMFHPLNKGFQQNKKHTQTKTVRRSLRTKKKEGN